MRKPSSAAPSARNAAGALVRAYRLPASRQQAAPRVTATASELPAPRQQSRSAASSRHRVHPAAAATSCALLPASPTALWRSGVQGLPGSTSASSSSPRSWARGRTGPRATGGAVQPATNVGSITPTMPCSQPSTASHRRRCSRGSAPRGDASEGELEHQACPHVGCCCMQLTTLPSSNSPFLTWQMRQLGSGWLQRSRQQWRPALQEPPHSCQLALHAGLAEQLG